jgi:hypothetical protein
MAKTKLRHLHKIKVHHNRWLVWAIAYAVIVAIAVFGYIEVSDITFENQIVDREFVNLRNYTDNRLGFTVRYPASWGIEASSESSVIFLPIQIEDEGVQVSVRPLSVESDLREALDIVSESRSEVDGITATEITYSVGSTALETTVLVRHNDQLYSITGSKKLVNKFLTTFRFIHE